MENHELEAEMGEAINFENVLTVITVLLLLRMVFMVPLVNIEKVRTEHVTKEGFWTSLSRWIGGNIAPSPVQAQYAAALETEASGLLVTDLPGGKARYVEFLAANGDLHAIEHDLATGNYVSLVVQDQGGVFLFRTGVLKWSPRDKEWFIDRSRVIPTGDPGAVAMLANYRQWGKARRGL